MADLVTTSTLVQQVRRLSDSEHQLNYITDSEIIDNINRSYSELYDGLVNAYESYFVAPFVTFSVQAGTWPQQYQMPLPPDYYKTDCVAIKVPAVTNAWHTIRPRSRAESYRSWGNTRVTYGLYGVPQPWYVEEGQYIEFFPQDGSIIGQTFQLVYYPNYQPIALGVTATATIQDITYTSQISGSAGNNISVTYVGGGTAGNETVSTVGNAITVTIQNGLSSPAQIVATINQDVVASTLVLGLVTGNASNPQIAQPQTFLAGGTNDGTIDGVNGWAHYVEVDAALQCIIKMEKDPSALLQRKNDLYARIFQNMANKRDASGQSTIPAPRDGWDEGSYGGGPSTWGGLW